MRIRPSQRYLRFLLGGFLLAGALIFLNGGIMPWSDLNSRHDEIDIRTGRVRHSHYLLYTKVSERVEETFLSRALPPDMIQNSRPDWQPVNHFAGISSYSPYYVFHVALAQIGMLRDASDFVPFSEEAHQEVARRILKSWQQTGGCGEADGYIKQVINAAAAAREAGKTILTIEDLPPAPTCCQTQPADMPD